MLVELRSMQESGFVEQEICSACGALYQPGETYCPFCGAYLAQVLGVGAQAELHPERHSQAGERSLSEVDEAAVSAGESIPGWLRILSTGALVIFPTGKTRLVLGRADIASSFFPDIDLEAYAGRQMGVSRRHARLTGQHGEVFLEDLNSTNCTFINQLRLIPGQRIRLSPGDRVQLGQLQLVYERPGN